MNPAGHHSLSASNHVPTPPALPAGLRALAEESPSGRLAKQLTRLSQRLEAGSSWEAALEASDVKLPEHIRGLIVAGLRTARLPDMLERLVDLQRRSLQTRREAWLGLAYPLVLMCLLIVMFVIYEATLVPELAAVYDDFGLQLPLVSRLVIGWSHPQAIAVMLSLIAAAAAVALVQIAFQPWWLSRAFGAAPLLGALWQWIRLVEFARILGLLIDAGVPLPDALEMTAAAIRGDALRKDCRAMAELTRQGQPLSAAMRQSESIPATLGPVIEWGEARSSLAEALDAAAEMFAGRLQVQLSFVRTFVPPFTFIVVAGVIVLALLAAFLPLIQLIQQLA